MYIVIATACKGLHRATRPSSADVNGAVYKLEPACPRAIMETIACLDSTAVQKQRSTVLYTFLFLSHFNGLVSPRLISYLIEYIRGHLTLI